MLTRTTRLIPLMFAAACVAPTSAMAVQTGAFVAPDGTGTACTASSPCALSEAFTRTVSDPITTITVGPGHYDVTGNQTAGRAITLTGDTTQARPVISFAGKSAGSEGIELSGAGSAADWIEIDDSRGVPITIGSAGTGGSPDVSLDDVVAIEHGSAAACVETRATIDDTVCRSSGGPGLIDRQAASEQPVTEISRSTLIGGPTGIQYSGEIGEASMEESIAEATDSAGIDITPPSAGSELTFSDGNNYRGAPASPTQQTALPTFTDAYHQAPDSPTIDASTQHVIFTSHDVDQLNRIAGAAVDLGASEFHTPTVTTAAATGISNTGATLAGTVTSFATLGTGSFQLGTTADYGTTIDAGAQGGVTATPLAGTATGLLPGTTYHYRAVYSLTSSSGAVFPFDGPDQTFTTTGTAPTPTPAPTPAPGGTGGSTTTAGGTNPGQNTTQSQPTTAPLVLTLASRGKPSKQKLRTGAAITATCSAACKLTASLTITARTAKSHGLLASHASAKTPVAVGTASSGLSAAGSKALQITLSKKALAKLRALRTLNVTVSVVATDAAGRKTTKTLTLTLHH